MTRRIILFSPAKSWDLQSINLEEFLIVTEETGENIDSRLFSFDARNEHIERF